jgi:hypothetical protein
MEIENDVFNFGEIITSDEIETKTEKVDETTESKETTASTETVKVEPTKEVETTTDDNNDVLKTNFEYFKESKILPDTAEFDGTEEGFVSTVKEHLKNEALDEIWNSLPSEEGKALLEYLLNGGTDIAKFKETFTTNWETFQFSQDETEKEAQQKQVLVDFYKSKGFTDKKAEKEADLKIQFAEGDDAAAEALEELKEAAKLNKQKLIDEQKQATLKAQDEYAKNVNEFVSTLKETKDINGVSITDKERNAIFNLYYGTTKTKEGEINNLNLVINSVLADKEKSLQLAQYLLNGLTVKSDKTTAKTEAIKSLRDKLKSASEGQTKIKGNPADRSTGPSEIFDIG